MLLFVLLLLRIITQNADHFMKHSIYYKPASNFFNCPSMSHEMSAEKHLKLR